MKRSQERRKSPRIAYLCNVTCVTPDGHSFLARITEISIGGAHIDSTEAYLDRNVQLSVGAQLQVSLVIESQELNAGAVVRHSANNMGIGIEFLELSLGQQETISSLLKERLDNNSHPPDWTNHSQSKGSRKSE